MLHTGILSMVHVHSNSFPMDIWIMVQWLPMQLMNVSCNGAEDRY